MIIRWRALDRKGTVVSRKLSAISDRAFRLWVYMLCVADDHGYFESDLWSIKAKCLSGVNILHPWKDNHIEDAIAELETVGLIERFETKPNEISKIVRFDEFQPLNLCRARRSSQLHDIIASLQRTTTDDNGQQSLKEENKKENKNRGEEIGDAASGLPPCPYQEIVSLYEQACVKQGMPAIRELTDKRKKAVRVRWAEHPTLEWFAELFTKASESRFLCGTNERNFVASFDWLIKPANCVKVLEGNYVNRMPQKSETNKGATVDQVFGLLWSQKHFFFDPSNDRTARAEKYKELLGVQIGDDRAADLTRKIAWKSIGDLSETNAQFELRKQIAAALAAGGGQ